MGSVSDGMELLLWPDGDTSQQPERWVRTGACHRCGACCERTERPNYLMGLLTDDAPEDTEGTADPSDGAPASPIVAECWDGHWTFWRAMAPRHGGCPMWRGEGVCAIYGTDEFPDVCRKWPVFPGEMAQYPACGFHFERIA